jgi:hypothetical protein
MGDKESWDHDVSPIPLQSIVIELAERENLLLPTAISPVSGRESRVSDRKSESYSRCRVMVGATICFRQFSSHFYFMLRFHLGFNLWSQEYCVNDRKAMMTHITTYSAFEGYESWPVFLRPRVFL